MHNSRTCHRRFVFNPGPGWARSSHNSVLVFLLEHASNYFHNHAAELEMDALAVLCPQGIEVRWASYVEVAAYLVAHKSILLARLDALFEARVASTKSYEADGDARLARRPPTRERAEREREL